MRFEIKGTADQVHGFYDRLKQSEHPWNEFYARCGLLARAIAGYPQSDIGRPLRDELNDLRMFLEQHAPGEEAELVRSTYLAEFDRLKQLIERRERAMIPPRPNPTPDALPFVQLPSRIDFQKIDERRCYWESIQRCSDALDLCWRKHEVTLVPEPGRTISLHRAQIPEEHVASAHWDGRYVWVVTMASGVRVFDTDARQVVFFRRPQIANDDIDDPRPKPSSQEPSAAAPAGEPCRDDSPVGPDLPPYERIHKLHETSALPLRLRPIGPGRAIFVGRYGKLNRLWFAQVQVGDPAKVDVFHTCTKVRPDPEAPDDDPEQIFLPCWMTEWQEPRSGRRLLIVGRMQQHGDRRLGRRPLAVDLETLEASVFLFRFPAANLLTRYSFDSRILHIEGSRANVFTPNPEDPNDWDHAAIAAPYDYKTRPGQQVIDHEGALYVTGTHWLRIDRATWEADKLTTQPLPDWMQFMRYGLSAHHGLVAWNLGKPLHRVTIVTEDPGKAKSED